MEKLILIIFVVLIICVVWALPLYLVVNFICWVFNIPFHLSLLQALAVCVGIEAARKIFSRKDDE